MGMWKPWGWLDVITEAVERNSKKIKNCGSIVGRSRAIDILSRGGRLLRMLTTRRKSERDEAPLQQHFFTNTVGISWELNENRDCHHHHHHQYYQHASQWEGTNSLTCSWQPVLWGFKQRVQGFNGLNAAHLSCPQGSTLTFQHKAGVPCGIGLRHGVTMHPRGRHLREGMILLPHGTYNVTAREQQPTTQQPYNSNNWWRPWSSGIINGRGVRPSKRYPDIISRGYQHREVSSARSQSEELYNIFKSDERREV